MKEDTDRERRADLLHKLKAYFREERDEDLGDLAANLLLDFIEREMGPAFYNQGVKDAKAKTVSAFATLTEEMDYLERLVPKRPGKRPAR
jgi:uncharacterized protein (DUF2164 family)